LVVVN